MIFSGYEIHIDDLPEDCRDIAEIIGLDNLIALVKARGGETLYLPKPERLAIGARNRMICKQFDGRNYRELARKYDLTETWIREIVAEGRSGGPSHNKQKQMVLFDQS